MGQWLKAGPARAAQGLYRRKLQVHKLQQRDWTPHVKPCRLLTGAPTGVAPPGSTPLIVQDDADSDTLVPLPEDCLPSCQCRNALWAMQSCTVHLDILVLVTPVVEVCSSLPCQVPHILIAPGADVVSSALQPAACMLAGLSRSVGLNALRAWLQSRDQVQMKPPASSDAR